MKKIYQVPTSQTLEIRTNGILALSMQEGASDYVTDENKDEFEQLSNKKNAIWGDDTYNSHPW